MTNPTERAALAYQARHSVGIAWDSAPIATQFGARNIVVDGVATLPDGREYRINATADRFGRFVDCDLRHLSPGKRGNLIPAGQCTAIRVAAVEAAVDVIRAFRCALRFGETRPTLETLAPRIVAAMENDGRLTPPEPATIKLAGFADEPAAPVVETVDITPTWEGLMPALLAIVENGNATGRAYAIGELTRLAKAADTVAMQRDIRAACAESDNDEGRAAAKRNAPPTACPYDAGSGRAANWLDGYASELFGRL